MKRFLFSIWMLALSFVANAATITGPIYLTYSNRPYTGPILIRPLSTPLPWTPNLVTGGDFKVSPDTNGLFSVELQPGNYRVTIGADRPFTIDVPTNAATYTLLERITNALSWNSSILPYTNVNAIALTTRSGTVKASSDQGDPVAWLTNETATIGARIGQLTFATVDAMIAAPVPVYDGVGVETLGRTTAGDGGGAKFVWNASSTASTNQGTVFQNSNTSTGRYIANPVAGYTSTKQWGIFPGTVTESQVSILNNAIAWNAANGLYTRLDTGEHRVQTNIVLVSNANVVGSPESSWLRDYTLQSRYDKALFSIANAPLPTDPSVTAVPIVATNITLKGVIAGATSTNKLGPLIAFLGVDVGRIQDCEIRPGAYDWSITWYGNNGLITGNRIKSVYPDSGSTIFTDGIHILGGTNGVIANNIIETGDDNIAWTTFNNAGISHWTVDGNNHKSWRANALRFQQESAWATNLIQNISITGGTGEAGLLRNGLILFYNNTATNNPYPFRNISISHYKLRGGGLDGQPTPIGLSYGIHANGVDGLKLIDVSLENTPYGNYIWGCKDVTIDNAKFSGGLYSSGFLAPLRVQDCTDLKISGGRFVPDLTTVASVQIVSVTNSVISGGAYIEGKNNGQPALLYSLYNGSVKVIGNKIVNTAVGGSAIVFANDPLNAIVAGNTLSATTPLFWSATGLPPKGSRVHWNEGIPEKETDGTTFDVLNTANNGYVGSLNSRFNATKLQIQATNGMITLAQDGVNGGTKNIRLGAQPSDSSKNDNALFYSSDGGSAAQLTINGGTALMNSHQNLYFNVATNSYDGSGMPMGLLTYRGWRLEKNVGALASPDSFLQVVSTEHGSRPTPQLTTAQANAISIQNQGLWIWNTDEISPAVTAGASTSLYRYLLPRISADRGDADVTLVSTDEETQRFATTLTANRTVNLPASNVRKGDKFRIVRTGSGAFTLNVGGIKTIPASTAATVDVQHNGSVWQLAGYMEHSPTAGSGVSDGDKGDITVSGTGTIWTIDPSSVTYAKMQNVSATSRLLGRNSSTTGPPEEITLGSGLSMSGTTLSVTGGGTGDVVGPASATDNAIARFDLTTGKLIQNSAATIADTTGDITAGKYNGVTISGSSTPTLAVTGTTTVSGANTGDQTITLTGDVTGSGTGSFSATIANSAVSNAKMANMTASTIKARVTGSTGAPEDATLSQVLDLVGSAAQGDILYRGASTWTRLGAGTTGQFLKTQGTGANPLWASVPGGGDALVANPLSQFAATTSLQLAGVISDETGSGALVFGTSPTLTTPTLGVATATTINKVALTAPATGSTLTIADGKTLTANNTLTFTGTDGSTLNIGTGGTLGTAAYTASSAYQATDAEITSLAGLTSAADKVPYFTGSGTASTADFTASGRTVVGQSSVKAVFDAINGAEATVASATTTDIGAASSDKVSITGTTTITGFGIATAGIKRSGRFTGALTLTHNATSLILPGSANITTVAGDRFEAVSLGAGNWVVYNYQTATWQGTGAEVHATSPTLTTPNIGVATATSVNKLAITAPATSATLTISDGKTAAFQNSITFAGTDSTTMTFPSVSASIGYLGIPQGSKSADYTLVLADAGTHIFHPSSDANSRTFTIPANGSVAFPVGTAVTFYNASANSCTIAITTDTLRKAGTGTTGSVTLPQYAMATALKVTTTEWVISGNGI